MDIRRLQYFVAVVEAGSITGAAKKLHMSQPPLSTQMKLLEEELDVILFDRGSRNIQLTDAGRILYNRAVGILEMSEAAVQELKEFGNGVQGALRLGMISSAGTADICERIKRFAERYPKVTFEICEGNTLQLLEQLRQGRIETTLVRTPFSADGLEYRIIQEEPMMAVGAEKYFAGEPEDVIRVAQLAGKPLIIYRRWEPIIAGAFHEAGVEPNIFCKNDDARTTAIWADAGLGIALLPQTAVLRSWTPGIVKKVIKSEMLYTRMAVACRKDHYISGIARRFMEEFA